MKIISFERESLRIDDKDIIRFNYSDGFFYELNLTPIFLNIGYEKELEINIREQIFGITEEDLK